MDHTHIIQAGDLERYADTRESEGVIPELIYLLVKQSALDLLVCRIPYGDATNQPGLDGLVEASGGFLEFVPAGVSYWEIGTGADPQEKATRDFRKRTNEIQDSERSCSSFVFVTPRSAGAGGWNEPRQTAWLNRRKVQGWKRIQIIDGVKLADWLREFPAIGRWMAKKVGITPSLGGISTPNEHWEMILAQHEAKDPPLPPSLFTVARDNACNALQAIFEGKSKRLLLFAESPQDVEDFISAYLATLEPEIACAYANRCLYINEEDAWHSVVMARKSHILVANPRLGLESDKSDLQAVATQRGHSVIIPLCGAWSGESPEIIKLLSPSRSQMESLLKEAGYSDVRARELARIGGERISALRRHLLGLGTLPPYATWDNARLIAQAGLIGKWDGKNQSDLSAVEKLLGKAYGEWIEILRPDALRSDSPLIQHEETWRIVARGEAWSALGNRITDEDLDRLQEMAVDVLGERNPKFDLPKEERFAANIHGKQLKHSHLLREGLAETLALIGSRPKALSSCSHGKAETTVILVVRQLLANKDWDIWASLDTLLPLLAESAPDEFLDAVESALVDLERTPFRQVFAQEGSAGIGGGTYMSGLLWALETLAWHPDFLTRVAVILADLASIDPGGNWSNRPSNSLVDIFLPWHVQTTASLDKRKIAASTVLREQPEVGWRFLLGLLPHNRGFTTGCHRPTWRSYIPADWKDTVLKSEYWEQIAIYTELAVGLAKKSIDKLEQLVERLPDLPKHAHNNFLDYLASDEVLMLPEVDRLPIWEKLEALVRKHRKFADADWSLREDVITKIAATASALAPKSPELKYHYLFSDRDSDLFDEKGNYSEQRQRLDKVRQEAVRTIVDAGGLRPILAFAQSVSTPYEVGRALGNIGADEIETELLPPLLDSEDANEKRVISGYIWARFWKFGWTWGDSILAKNWDVTQKSAFLVLLPFEEDVWSRVKEHLAENDERLYWQDALVNPYGPGHDITLAIEKLIQYGRPIEAVHCVSRSVHDKSMFNVELATKALLAVLDAPQTISRLGNHDTVEVIKSLQQSPLADPEALFKIEWNFLPWLDQFSSGSPKTIENRLASNPTFFAEVISLVFRPRNQPRKDDAPSEHDRNIAQNAYRLLTEWRTCPGIQPDGSFDEELFSSWLEEAKQITETTGHSEVAQIQIGHVLTYAPPDPSGLWIHQAVASALNARDGNELRSGFTTELFNRRGVYRFTAGEEERKLALQNHEKANALEESGYSRFATAMREFAEGYERQAERESKRNPYDD